jgi:hypothetical protein
MARLETSGTRNCGVVSLSCLRSSFFEDCDNLTVGELDTKKLHNASQPHGTTKNYDFDELMKEVENDSRMSKRMIICAIPESYRFAEKGKLHKKLKKHGFRLIRKSGNLGGDNIWFYMRIPSPIPILKGDR